jgi:YaiO family outer membrane protein
VGGGYDESRTIAHDWRAQVEGAYYFEYPVVLQGGLTWTHATPGNILARTQYIAASQGHDKEHFVSLRYQWGREGYEVIGVPVGPTPAFNVLFDFPIRTITGSWRQWIGPNWGLNLNVEQHQETAYHRIGGTIGVFLDFYTRTARQSATGGSRSHSPPGLAWRRDYSAPGLRSPTP